MRDVKGKVVLITGAAMGMGKLLTEKFCKDGARVIMVDMNKEELKASRDQFVEQGFEVYEYVCDVSDPKQIAALATWAKKEVGPVQVLVNNAGVAFRGTLIDQDVEQISKIFDVNVKGVAWMMKAFLPDMIEANEGHILNLASASGFIGVPGAAAYASSKWAVIGLSESVRYEIRNMHKNIKFTIVCPSYVSTGMFEGVRPPRGTGFLSPKRIVNAMYDAFKKDKLYVLEPFMVKLTPTLKALLPPTLFDFMHTTLGLDKGASGLTGRN